VSPGRGPLHPVADVLDIAGEAVAAVSIATGAALGSWLRPQHEGTDRGRAAGSGSVIDLDRARRGGPTGQRPSR
jgi:hypothetical protein